MHGDPALSRDPECWRCPGHPVHSLPCEFCDCPTPIVGAAWAHDYDSDEE